MKKKEKNEQTLTSKHSQSSLNFSKRNGGTVNVPLLQQTNLREYEEWICFHQKKLVFRVFNKLAKERFRYFYKSKMREVFPHETGYVFNLTLLRTRKKSQSQIWEWLLKKVMSIKSQIPECPPIYLYSWKISWNIFSVIFMWWRSQLPVGGSGWA